MSNFGFSHLRVVNPYEKAFRTARSAVGASELLASAKEYTSVADAVADAHVAGPDHHWLLDVPAEPISVFGDGDQLHQVVMNLLNNARTHTPPGTKVTAELSTNHFAATLAIVDNGPGIPSEVLPEVFERFARGDNSRSRAAGSTGLGLAIVAAVVGAHRGDVRVWSKPGHTEFRVTLPLNGRAHS